MKRTLGTATALAMVAALAACSPSEGGSASAGAGGNSDADDVNIGTFMDLTSWDPSDADIGFDVVYLSAVYDPLIALDEESNPIPALATDWEYSDDFRTLTMNLREGVEFEDGEPFNAEAAVANLEALKDGVRSNDAYLNVESFEAVDEYTVEMTMKKKDDALLYFMGLGRSWMVSPTVYEEGTAAEEPVGSGPYSYDISASNPGSEYFFDKKEDHWNSEQFPFERVGMVPISDATAGLNAMLAGQLDVAFGAPENIGLAEENGWNVASAPASTVGIQFVDRAGEDLEPLGDKRVRQAINLAFNTEALLETAAHGAGERTNQLFPVTGEIYDESLNDMYAVDLDRAKELMAEAGYEDGFELSMPMAPPFEPYQPAVEQTLGDLGISVTWDPISFPDYHSNASTYPMFIAVSTMEADPVATVVRRVASPQWYNPEPGLDLVSGLEDKITEIEEATGEEQTALIKELNEELLEEAWWNIWYQADNVYFSVEGLTVSPKPGPMFPQLQFIQRS